MQAKMAGSPAWAQALYRIYFGIWIPTLAWAATWWPLACLYWVAKVTVMMPFNLLRPKYLRAVEGNIARILDLPQGHPRVRRAAWEMGYQHAYHWIDFFRWSQVGTERLLANIARVDGEEHFAAARASGRGTLLLTAHMGNPEVGAVAMGSHFEPVHLLYWRDRFATAEEFRTRMRLKGNVHGIPVDASPLSVVPALRILQAGGILAAHGDRDFNNQGWPVRFCGAEAPFPPGPFLLAARARALILPTFFLLGSDRRFEVSYLPPIEVPDDGDLNLRARAAMEQWIAILEAKVRTHPAQWYCFYPFWGEEGERRETID